MQHHCRLAGQGRSSFHTCTHVASPGDLWERGAVSCFYMNVEVLIRRGDTTVFFCLLTNIKVLVSAILKMKSDLEKEKLLPTWHTAVKRAEHISEA